MSVSQAMNVPPQRARRVLKRKPGEEDGTDAGDIGGAADAPAAELEGRGLEAVERLVGLAGVGIVGAVAMGMRGGGSAGVAMGMRGGGSAGVAETTTPKPVSPGVIDPVKPVVIEPVRPVIDPVKPVVVDPVKPVVDTLAPDAPKLALKRDTGERNDDRHTSDSTITVSGLEAGATWRYSVDGGKTWHDGAGQEFVPVLMDGRHTVQVIQRDQAGNDSAVASLEFTLDTGAPTLSLKNDTARRLWNAEKAAYVTDEAHAHDGITNDGTIKVGNLDPGMPWSYSRDQGRTWEVGSEGEIAASAMGADGVKTVWAKQMKASMTESGISAFSFELDTQIGLITPRLKTEDSIGAGGIPQTSRPVLVFDGHEAGAAVRIVISGDFPTRDEVVIGGELPLDLQPGRYKIDEIQQLDLAGNKSGHRDSGYLHFIVVPPVLP